MLKRNSFINRLFGLIKHNKRIFLATLLLIGASVAAGLMPPLVLERAVNELTSGLEVGISLAFTYFGLLALSGIAEAGQNMMITVLGQRITHDIRSNMCAKLKSLPADYFVRNEGGRITARFVADVDAVDALFTKGIVSIFADICKIIAIIGVIFSRSCGLGLLLLLILPILFYLLRLFQRRMLAAQLDNRAAVAKVNNHIPETLLNMRMIRNLRCKSYMEDKYDSYIEEGYRAVNRSNFYDSVYPPIIIMTSVIVISVMMLCGASNGELRAFFGINAGTAVAIIAYVGRIFSPFESLGMEIQNVQTALAGIKRIEQFLSEEERPVPGISAIEAAAKQSKACISFKQVRFGYHADEPLYDGLSFDIAAGENAVLIGRTGAGKSTAFRLLLGQYVPQTGSVQINGLESSSISDEQRRRLIGYVEQNCPMVRGSVAEQLSLGDREVSEVLIEEALRTVGLWSVVQALPQAINTPFEQAGFSQGQRQLLAIARAIVFSPPILLLDEITANLDTKTEERVLEALDKACLGRTVLAISHRSFGREGQKVIHIV